MNKKAISPFIASVLLIVITVVIGVLLANFVRSYLSDSVDSAQDRESVQIDCMLFANFEIVELTQGKEAYRNISNPENASVSFMIRNTGNMNISFIFTIFSEEVFSSDDSTFFENRTIDLETDIIEPQRTKRYKITHPGIATMTDVQITPAFVRGDQNQICKDINLLMGANELKSGELLPADYEARN